MEADISLNESWDWIFCLLFFFVCFVLKTSIANERSAIFLIFLSREFQKPHHLAMTNSLWPYFMWKLFLLLNLSLSLYPHGGSALKYMFIPPQTHFLESIEKDSKLFMHPWHLVLEYSAMSYHTYLLN